MNRAFQTYGPIVARILIATIFILAGVGKIFDFAGQVGYAGVYLPLPEVAVVVAIIFELIAGILLVIGYKTRIAAGVLFLYLIVVSLAFHTEFSDPIQMSMFMKNLAIMGGLLLLKVNGAGPLSLDNKKPAISDAPQVS